MPTAEELDALPVGSVLGYTGGAVHRQYQGAEMIWRATDGGNYRSAAALARRVGRLAVLYRPDETPDDPEHWDTSAARLRSGIEALADDWEAERGVVGDLSPWDDGFEAGKGAAAEQLRALLSADDETVGA